MTDLSGGRSGQSTIWSAEAMSTADSADAGSGLPRIVILSGGRLESQANEQVRDSIMDGWAELVGDARVLSVNIVGSVRAISEFRPDIVMAIGSYLPETTYFGEVARAARKVGAVLVFWATEDPYEHDASYRITRDFDLVLSCDLWGSRFYDHPRALHLPLAGCGRRHHVAFDPRAPRPIDVFFCGVAFANRRALLGELLPDLAGLQVQVIGPGWGEFGPGFLDQRIEKHALIEAYASAKIVLNLGRSLHFENSRHQIVPSTPGPRTFEAALAGALQLYHEESLEIRRYFTSFEIPSFSTAEELARLIRAFLSDPAGREARIVAAQDKALDAHTYRHRAEQVIAILRSENLL